MRIQSSILETNPFKNFYNCEDDCDDNGYSESNFLTQYDCSKKIQKEKESSDILTLYKQLKLQRELKKSEDLEHGIKESMLYTNYRLINEIADLIEASNTNYPKSYQQVVKSDINNTILTAIQLRKQHLISDPIGNRNPGNPLQSINL